MNRLSIIRYLLYSLEIFIALLMQSVPYPVFELYGAKALFLLPAAVTAAVFENEVPAVIIAAVCGVLADISYSGTIGLFSVMLTVGCFGVNIIFDRLFTERLITVMLVSGAVIIVLLLMHFLIYCVFAGYSDLQRLFAGHCMPRTMHTLLAVPVFYYANRLISGRTRRPARKNTVRRWH